VSAVLRDAEAAFGEASVSAADPADSTASEAPSPRRRGEPFVEEEFADPSQLHPSVMRRELERLRAQLADARGRARSDLEAAEARCVAYHDQVRALTGSLEEAIEENSRLDSELQVSEERRQSAEERAALLEANSQTLRKLVVGYMSDPERQSRARRTEAEERFWEQLATPELLAASEPPVGFRAPDFAAETRAEVLRTKLKNARRTERENLQLIDRLKENNAQLRTVMLQRYNDQKVLIGRQQKQLTGAVRRIHYLLEEKETLERRIKERGEYTFKIEQRLLQQNRRAARSRYGPRDAPAARRQAQREGRAVRRSARTAKTRRAGKAPGPRVGPSTTPVAAPPPPAPVPPPTAAGPGGRSAPPTPVQGKNAAELGWQAWRRRRGLPPGAQPEPGQPAPRAGAQQMSMEAEMAALGVDPDAGEGDSMDEARAEAILESLEAEGETKRGGEGGARTPPPSAEAAGRARRRARRERGERGKESPTGDSRTQKLHRSFVNYYS
jgi:hypothetical protein